MQARAGADGLQTTVVSADGRMSHLDWLLYQPREATKLTLATLATLRNELRHADTKVIAMARKSGQKVEGIEPTAV